MKNVLIFACSVVAAPAFAGLSVYENDFSARSSMGAVPSGKWRQQDYATGIMANTNYVNPFAGTGAGGSQQMQDGWIKDHVYSVAAAASVGNANVYWDGGNNMVALGTGPKADVAAVIVKQRIGNTFTNGTVTIQFDFLSPQKWSDNYTPDIDRRMFLSVGDEDFYSPESGRTSIFGHTAANVGVGFKDGRQV
jgi:hypothetical protein